MGNTTTEAPGGLPKAPETEADKPKPIEFADFQKLDIRVGKIETAERVPKSKKLIKLGVFFGDTIGRRTIVAGIGDHADFSVEGLVNQHKLFVVNLAPRALMGIESHGMILGAADAKGLYHAATCGTEAEPGAKVG